MTARTIMIERINDNLIVNIVQQRRHVYSVFATNERDGYICFDREFATITEAKTYAERIVAKLSK